MAQEGGQRVAAMGFESESWDEEELLPTTQQRTSKKKYAMAAVLAACLFACVAAGAFWNSGQQKGIEHPHVNDLVELYQTIADSRALSKDAEAKGPGPDSAEAKGKDGLPACLHNIKNKKDFEECGKTVLKGMKRAGASKYQMALGGNLLTGKPLSPEMALRQAEEMTKHNSNMEKLRAVRAKKENEERLATMTAQNKALMKSSQALLKKTEKATAALTKATCSDFSFSWGCPSDRCTWYGSSCKASCSSFGNDDCPSDRCGWTGSACEAVTTCATSNGCFTSGNYPADYGNHESCTIVASDILNGSLQVTHFETEKNVDKLTINGVHYSGSRSSFGIVAVVTPTAHIIWTSDYSDTASGWQLCKACSDFSTENACPTDRCTWTENQCKAASSAPEESKTAKSEDA